MKKNIIALSAFVLLVSIVGGGYYFGFKGDKATANPDYICVKSVTAQPCKNVVWGAWKQNGTRTGTGTKATQIGYYQTRTACEAGFGAARYGSTSVGTSAANYMINNGNSSKLYSNWNQWISGRHSSNFTYSSTSCTVTQVDKITPVGTFR